MIAKLLNLFCRHELDTRALGVPFCLIQCRKCRKVWRLPKPSMKQKLLQLFFSLTHTGQAIERIAEKEGHV